LTIEELVRESAEYWGVPEQMEDPELLAQVAAVMRNGGDAPGQ
jgi:hypothetical protein